MTTSGDSTDGVGIAVGETVGAALARIGRAQFDRVSRGLGGDPDRDTGTHEARKALKRLRALLRMVRPHLDADLFAAEDGALRDVGRALAPLRDARVTIDTLDAIAPGMCPVLGAALEQHHAEVLDSMPAESMEAPAVAMQEAGERWAAVFAGSVPEGFEAVAPGVARTYRRGRKRMRRAAERSRDEDFHEWRKEVKHLRYQMEALQPLDPGALAPVVALLYELGELLGSEHDLTVLAGLVEPEAGCGDARTALLQLISERRHHLRRAAVALGGEAYRAKRSVLVESLGHAWESAHREVE